MLSLSRLSHLSRLSRLSRLSHLSHLSRLSRLRHLSRLRGNDVFHSLKGNAHPSFKGRESCSPSCRQDGDVHPSSKKRDDALLHAEKGKR